MEKWLCGAALLVLLLPLSGQMSWIFDSHPNKAGVVVALEDGSLSIAQLRGGELDELSSPPEIHILPSAPIRLRFQPAAPMDGFRLPRDGAVMIFTHQGFLFEAEDYDRMGVDVSFRTPFPAGAIFEVWVW